VGLTPHPDLVPKVLEKSRAIPLLILRTAYKKGEKLKEPKNILRDRAVLGAVYTCEGVDVIKLDLMVVCFFFASKFFTL